MMHPIDAAIFDGRLTADLLDRHAHEPLPAEGCSYWGDAMRRDNDPIRAAGRAARAMGATLESLRGVRR